MLEYNPDIVIALGGGSAMDAAKIMWVLYEHPELRFRDLAMRFMDIRKRIVEFPEMGKKAKFVAVATSAGTGSEVTPFSVITDDETGIKYPLADYALTPNVAINDPELMLTMPKGLTYLHMLLSLMFQLWRQNTQNLIQKKRLDLYSNTCQNQ